MVTSLLVSSSIPILLISESSKLTLASFTVSFIRLSIENFQKFVKILQKFSRYPAFEYTFFNYTLIDCAEIESFEGDFSSDDVIIAK